MASQSSHQSKKILGSSGLTGSTTHISRTNRWAWFPVPILFLAVLSQASLPFEPDCQHYPHLIPSLDIFCRIIPCLAIAFLMGRSFLTSGSPGLLFLGCGALVWGSSSFIPTTSCQFNVGATISGLGTWLAALCHLLGASIPFKSSRIFQARKSWLAYAYLAAVGTVVVVIIAVQCDKLPVVFDTGKGGTVLHHFVLGSALLMFMVSALLLWEDNRPLSPFARWYVVALLLIWVAVFGAATQSTCNSIFNWTCRAAQYLAGLYMYMAALASTQRTEQGDFQLTRTINEGRYRYLVGTALVLAAAAIRLALLEGLGTRSPFVTFYPAVIFTSLYGGYRAGLLTTLLSVLIADYFWIEPLNNLSIAANADQLAVVIYIFSCAVICCVTEAMRRAITKAKKAETLFEISAERKQAIVALQEQNDDLELHVAARTRELANTIESLQTEIRRRETIEKDLRHTEERHMLAVESTGIGTFDFYPGTGVLFWSEMTRKHFGVNADAHCDYSVFLAGLHPDDRAREDSRIAEALKPQNGGTYRAIYRTIGIEDGRERWIKSCGQVFFNSALEPARFIGITCDITKEKVAEDTILRLNRLYRVISACNQAIIHSTSPHGLFKEVCRVAVELGGFRLAWIGLVDDGNGVNISAAKGDTGYLESTRPLSELEDLGLVRMCVRDGAYFLCNDFLKNGMEDAWRRKAEACNIHAVASVPIRHNQKVIGALVLYAGEKNYFDPQQVELLQQMGSEVSFALDAMHQASAQRETEAALNKEVSERLKALEKLREKDQLLIQQSRLAAMGEMISYIAHQWRQPLNNLGLLAQQLKIFQDLGALDGELVKENVASSMQIIQHMSNTISDFSDFFKPDKAKAHFSVAEVIRKTISLLEMSLASQNIAIDFQAADDHTAFGFEKEYAQVVLVIIQNARDIFCERNVREPRITISVTAEEQRSVATIADNGGGVPIHISDRIFEPYFTTKGSNGGTGLGLFMSKMIIEKNMGGSLTVRNVAGGAEFSIQL